MLLWRRKLSSVSVLWSEGAVERWFCCQVSKKLYALWGCCFTLKTDHQALTTLLTTKGEGCAGLCIMRGSAHFMSYNYGIAYRPGKENAPADYMSHLPLPSVSSVENQPSTPADDDMEYVALLNTAYENVASADLDSACASSLTKLVPLCPRAGLLLERASTLPENPE